MSERYPLASVRKLRHRTRDAARQRLAEARDDHTQAEARLAEVNQRLEQCAAETETAARSTIARNQKGRTIGEIRTDLRPLAAHEEVATKMRRQSQRQEQEILEALERLNRALDSLTKAQSEAQAIDRHFEDWREENESADQRREEEEHDELAQRK